VGSSIGLCGFAQPHPFGDQQIAKLHHGCPFEMAIYGRPSLVYVMPWCLVGFLFQPPTWKSFIYCVIWQEQVPCAWTHAFDSGMLCLWNTAICIFNVSQDSKCILSLAVRYTDILQNRNSWCPWNALVSNHVPGFSPLSLESWMKEETIFGAGLAAGIRLRPVGPKRPEGLGSCGHNRRQTQETT
jgi:hypothetical protein